MLGAGTRSPHECAAYRLLKAALRAQPDALAFVEIVLDVLEAELRFFSGDEVHTMWAWANAHSERRARSSV